MGFVSLVLFVVILLCFDWFGVFDCLVCRVLSDLRFAVRVYCF